MFQSKKMVTLAALPDGAKFRYHIPEWNEAAKRVEYHTSVIGTKIYGSLGSVRVQLPGKQHQVVFGEGNKQRVFTAEGAAYINWPTTTEVEPLTVEQHDDAEWALGGAFTMDNTKVTAALNAKLKHAIAKLDAAKVAGDDAEVETFSKRVEGIKAEMEEKGIEVTGAAPAPKKVVTVGKGKTEVKTETVGGPAQTKGEKLKAANKARLANLAAAKSAAKTTAVVAANGKIKPKAKKAEKLDSTRDCLCGCGLETNGLFRPGHDARVKGMLLKVERGEMKLADLDAGLQSAVKFAGKSATAGKEGSDYRIVHAPVKFPGRPDIEVVRPE